MPECPDCHGEREKLAFVNRGPDIAHHSLDVMQCMTCHGSGMITHDHAERIKIGAAMRKARVAAGVSIFDAAEQMGCTSAELSATEHGRT